MRRNPDDVEFVERIDDADTFLSGRGRLVQTDSNHQAYAVIRSLDWHPNCTIVTEYFYPEATAILARLGEPMRKNSEQMGFDPKYWGNKLDAYPKWETVWWREVVQNARDARGPERPDGPDLIQLECREETFRDLDGNEVEAVRCSCEDNGIGMSAETLRKAFLTFGGSEKPTGSTGGFGDAKEIIIIPWLGFEIWTRDKIARGRHNTFDIVDAPKSLSGTKVTVWMPRDRATTVVHATAFVERCNLPMRITVNGKSVRADLMGGEQVFSRPVEAYVNRDYQNVGSVAIFHNARSRRRGFLIRARGLYMFDRYLDDSSYKGIVYVELTGHPRDLFDQKRVELSYNTNVRSLIDQFVADLTVDPRTTLKKERADKGKMRELFKGTGALRVQQGLAAEVAAQMAMQAPVPEQKTWKDGAVEFSDAAIEKIAELAGREPTQEPGAHVPPIVSNGGAIREMLRETKFVSRDHAASALRLMAWQPVFLLINSVDYYQVPAKVRPDGMTPTYQKLAELWTELCRFVLMRLGWTKPFGTGFIFEWNDEEEGTVLAAYTSNDYGDDNLDFLVLNPIKLKKKDTKYDSHGDVSRVIYDEVVRWELTNDETLKMLCAAAIHECTHMVNGIGRHNEAFTSAMTENMGAMMDMYPVAKKIRKAVMSHQAATRRKTGSETVASANALTVRWRIYGPSGPRDEVDIIGSMKVPPEIGEATGAVAGGNSVAVISQTSGSTEDAGTLKAEVEVAVYGKDDLYHPKFATERFTYDREGGGGFREDAQSRALKWAEKTIAGFLKVPVRGETYSKEISAAEADLRQRIP